VTSLWNALRTYWLSLLFLALNMALLAFLYDRLPDPVPSLWSDDGKAIDWIAKPTGALLLPLAHLVITLFLIIAPAVDPGSLRAQEPPRFYPLIVAIISGFLMLATGTVFAAALGASLSLPRTILGGLGVLLALIGNYLGKVPKNQMVGIRTPWTLASELVWERTHRFAAPLFVASGTALALYCILSREHFSSLLGGMGIVATLLVPYFHSYLTWKRVGNGNAS
jgi:uncharacterized membrane protein